jgi:uncharacterized membrane protein YccC
MTIRSPALHPIKRCVIKAFGLATNQYYFGAAGESLLRGKSEGSLSGFCTSLVSGARLKAVAMDMSGAYAASVRAHAPHAMMTFDPAECWQETGNLLEILNDDSWPNAALRGDAVAAQQTRLRETLDRTLITLNAAHPKRMRPLLTRLERLHLLSSRFGTQALALDTAMETRGLNRGLADAAAGFDPVFQSLENVTRAVAMTIVSRQPSHLTALDVRLRRLKNLLEAARTAVIVRSTKLPLGKHLADILGQIESLVPEIKSAVRDTTDRASERGAFSLELLDLHTWRLGSLRAALNLSARIDRSLMRYILRLGTLLILSVLVYKWFEIPHGYWLGLTLVVVMQPDYGSTRQRAAERVLRTLLGSVLASGLLFLHLPDAALLAAAALTPFFFALFLKRRYDVAVVVLTLMVVLLTEIGGPPSWQLTFERLASTLAGGGLALLAAHIFWPAWEKDRFQPLISEALLAGREYIKLLCRRLREGTGRGPELVPAKDALRGLIVRFLRHCGECTVNQKTGRISFKTPQRWPTATFGLPVC